MSIKNLGAIYILQHDLKSTALTKVLHPDREMDEKEKIRKGDLMKRANISYKNKDLLSLLELQFEIEQANQSRLDGLSNEKLEIYNRLLQKNIRKPKMRFSPLNKKLAWN